MSVSGFLRAGLPGVQAPSAVVGAAPTSPPIVGASSEAGVRRQRNDTVTVIAGVGVLLLAMGVGVLIGRASSSPPAARPEIVTIGTAPSGSAPSALTEAAFTSDWRTGKSGYAVQLQTLPEAGTSVTQVEQAKSSATAKGAGAVGALKSEEFSSLTAGSYVVYSGDFRKKGEALKALSGLAKKFPGAKVIHISDGSGSSSRSGEGKKAAKGSGSDLEHPAPASVLEGVSKAKGKSYEEKSKNLPNVVETG